MQKDNEMRVWVLTSSMKDYKNRIVHGVFSSIENAENHIKERSPKYVKDEISERYFVYNVEGSQCNMTLFDRRIDEYSYKGD